MQVTVQNMSHATKRATFKTFNRLSVSFYVFYVNFGYMFNGNHWKNARITIIHVYFRALTLAKSLGLVASGSNNFLEPRQMSMHGKNMYDPYIQQQLCLPKESVRFKNQRHIK